LVTLDIFLLTHNRPHQAFEAIKSIIAQDDCRYSLVVSDNSDDDTLGQLIEFHRNSYAQLSNVSYRKRTPVVPAFDHFNICLNETRSDYVCLFHDDDLMLPQFISRVHNAIAKYPNAVAYGANSLTEINGVAGKIFFTSDREYLINNSSRELLAKYFGRYQLGVAPFPSYVYKSSAIQDFRFDPGWGKYGDVTWLLSVACHGFVVWINEPLMIYRLHDGNDSLTESRRDRLRFLAFLKKNIEVYSKGLLNDYRFFLYKKNLPNLLHENKNRRRTAILRKYISLYRIFRWLRLDHYGYLLNKLKVRLYLHCSRLFSDHG
jgi:glycosyltransferase involved in cell wall biosynthesis